MQFQSIEKRNDTWLSPLHIINSLGKFDLDPCTPVTMPWQTAEKRFTIADDGLLQKWFGRVWLNPPYSNIEPWLIKMINHKNGIALLPANTDTNYFHQYVWDAADSIFFIKRRLRFHYIDGSLPKKGDLGRPSVLIAYGENNVQAIADSKIPGKHLPVKYTPIIVVGISPSWFSVVKIALKQTNNTRELKIIYDLVERIAPDKVAKNRNYKAKIRQQVYAVREKFYYDTTHTS